MPLEPALLAFAGMGWLALANRRFRRDSGLARLPDARLAQAFATVLLGLAIWRAVAAFGPAQGVVAWIGMISLAGLLFVLLASRWPHVALAAAFAAPLFVLA